MKFSGHETFPVREGWLHKGLKLLGDNASLFSDDQVADHLGVGRNMAKSIKHWLHVTGLSELSGSESSGNQVVARRSKLGEMIWDRDPFFLEIGTWWILHINLVSCRDAASSWYWFFNKFGHDRFDRAVCLEALCRYIGSEGKRVFSTSTIQRDLGCMLLSYARSIPPVNEDPEDGTDCPFRALGLLSYYKTSGYYQVNQGVKDIPLDVFCYSMSKAFGETMERAKTTDIRLHDAARHPFGPGKAFCLSEETLFELVSTLESRSFDGQVQIVGSAGDRFIRVRSLSPLDWIDRFYKHTAEVTYAF